MYITGNAQISLARKHHGVLRLANGVLLSGWFALRQSAARIQSKKQSRKIKSSLTKRGHMKGIDLGSVVVKALCAIKDKQPFRPNTISKTVLKASLAFIITQPSKLLGHKTLNSLESYFIENRELTHVGSSQQE